MRDDALPVTVSMTREDGSVEHVQVGTAHRRGDGFSIRMYELTIGGGGDVRPAAPRRAAAPGAVGGGGGAGGEPSVFPPYGRSKGLPIRGASPQDLEFYATGARRTLGDPAKARFHDKERALLAVIEAELARQSGEGGDGGGDEPPPHGDDDAF